MASALMIMVTASRPHVAFRGCVPGTHSFSDIDVHPEDEELPGVLVFRSTASLLYIQAVAVLEAVLVRRRAPDTSSIRMAVYQPSDPPYVAGAGSRDEHALHIQLN